MSRRRGSRRPSPYRVVKAVSRAPVNAIYSYASYKDYNYQKAYRNDINRFYADYYKNTGHKPKYPYKQGAVYNDARLIRAYAGMFRW